MNQNIEEDWFEQIPKIELHLHLEGAIPHETLWELIQKYGGDNSISTLESVEKKFEYKDFPHFIETWVWKNQFLREYEDFTFIAESVARDLVGQNIRYAEMFFSPSDFTHHGLNTQLLVAAIHQGLEKIKEIEIGLIADFVRDFGPKRAEITLAEINEVKELGIVGVGIGGSEQNFPPEPFGGIYEAARDFGLHTSAHAGEAAGPESMWGAIRDLKVDRIGHGTRAEEDEALLDYLVEHRIPIEMCPLSNVRTGVVKSYEEHPVRRYFERGVSLSINTDDPKMFGNSMADEYRLLKEKKGFTLVEIKKLILEAIAMSWMPRERKQQMKIAIDTDPIFFQI